MAKLTNHSQRTSLTTPPTDKHHSLDSLDDFRSGCQNDMINQQHQLVSDLETFLKLLTITFWLVFEVFR